MGNRFESQAQQFVKNHSDLTDSTAANDNNGAARYSSEQIADDLNRAMKGMSAADQQQFLTAIANEGQKHSHDNDYATFSKGTDGHLHVKTRGFHKPINFGMSTDSDLNSLAAKRANLGGYGSDGGAGREGGY